ncbi:TonB-dependent receptor [Solimonas terrae]|uniref:TonB-dependent receptor n=1 Tax=Solimonas terrae TaxID=1396819 RepID=A0A6M2BMM9_9GAMM|nr:TonB-dependent receptor [Solimonas terrae]NGY03273.1 TonB-dependent receptor [Solimonas terrae]
MQLDTRTVVRLSALAVAGSLAAFDSTVLHAQPATPDENAASSAVTPPAADGQQDVDQPADATPSGDAPLATIPLAEKAAPIPSTPAPVAVDQIPEIVVTATKRKESIRNIPESITAISGQSLEDHGHLNLVDFVQDTPGVTVTQASPGLTHFSIRGISTDTSPSSSPPSPVGFFIGDTAFSDPYLGGIVPDLSAFDLAGVQVLKGPQGTLFGGAALSGAIRYELQQPVQGEWQVRGFAQTIQPRDGSLAVTGGAAVNIPVLPDDNLALRLAYVRHNYPGVIDDTRSGEKDIDHGGGNQYRAILAWEPDDWRLRLTHLSQDYAAPNAVFSVDSPTGPRETDINVIPVPAHNKFGLDSLEVDHDFDAFKVVSLTSRVFKDGLASADGTNAIIGPPPAGYPSALGFPLVVTETSDAYAQELRLQSADGTPFEWLVGGYYYRYTMDYRIHLIDPLTEGLIGPDSPLYQLAANLGLPIGTLYDDTGLLDGTSHVKSTEKALFADLSYTLWDHLKLSAGARLYQTAVAGGFIGTGLLVRAENNGMDADSRARLTEHGINPKFTATYEFSDDISVYLQVAKGFRFGGIQVTPSTPTNGVPPTFKSDTLWNHEIGLRTSWLHRTLTADLTAFYIRYKNPIISQSTQGIPLGYNDNVSGAISRGLESAVVWNTPLRGFSVSLTGALTDAYITAPFTASGNVQIESGQEMPGTAPQQYNASMQYLRPIGNFEVEINTGYNYVSKGYSNIQHDIDINGYGTWDAGLILGSEALFLSPKLAINLSNILDVARPNSGAVVGPVVPVGDFRTYNLIPPRTLTMRLSLEF